MSACEKTAKNRAEFPAAAAILDEFRQVFGNKVKLVYASEAGREIGKRPVAPKRFMTVDQWLRTSELIDEELARRELKPIFDSMGKLRKGSRS